MCPSEWASHILMTLFHSTSCCLQLVIAESPPVSEPILTLDSLWLPSDCFFVLYLASDFVSRSSILSLSCWVRLMFMLRTTKPGTQFFHFKSRRFRHFSESKSHHPGCKCFSHNCSGVHICNGKVTLRDRMPEKSSILSRCLQSL